MTFQNHRYPKSRISLRLTNDNYDFVYHVAKINDASIARTVNELISQKAASVIDLLKRNSKD